MGEADRLAWMPILRCALQRRRVDLGRQHHREAGLEIGDFAARIPPSFQINREPMHSALQRNTFFVKEHVGMFRAANNYDIFEPASGQKILECREPNLGFFTKIFRFTEYKRFTPFEVEITTPEGHKVLTVRRGISLLLSKVDVLDENDRLVGRFKQKLFSIGGKFDVLDASGEVVCTLKGKWTSWDFRFMKGETELGSVTKEWAGLGKELFTSADNYMLQISDRLDKTNPARILIMAAVMCIDMVLKE
jgi:uncharacterized protein YxjI